MEDVMAQNNPTPAAELVNAASTAAPAVADREQQALALVKSYVPWSAGVGLLPVPLLDMAALVAVQLRMLSKLSDVYGVSFVENSVKGVVSSLLGSVVSSGIGAGLGSLVRIVPVVGPLVGIAALPGAYGAATYAIGRVFISHFESGGTFLDFDPQKTRAYFLSEFEKAKVEQPQAA